MENSELNEKRNLVGRILGPDGFMDLIMELPDEFYQQDQAGQLECWKKILHEVNRGERDVVKLAGCLIQENA